MRPLCVLVVLVLALVLAAGNVYGQWEIDGKVICDEIDEQKTPNVISDGVGGWIIAWNDDRSQDNDFDLYVQRINSSGTPLWLHNGLPVCLANRGQYPHSMCMTADGDIFIAWEDYRDNYRRIYAQRIRLDGTFLWSFDGVIVSSTSSQQSYTPILYPFDDGSVIVAWRQDNYVRAQRVDTDGNKMWQSDGVYMSSYSTSKREIQINTDDRGGVIVTWNDYRNLWDVYAQRCDSTGSVFWGSQGIPVTSDSRQDEFPHAVADGDGGVVVFWRRDYGAYDAMVAQRIYRNGNQLWGSNGVELTSAQNPMWDPKLVSDGSGGALALWREQRYGSRQYLMLQRIDIEGMLLWGPEGVNAGRANSVDMRLISDGNGGAVFSWVYSDIFVQRINGQGELQYPMSSVIGADGTHTEVAIGGDGTGRTLMAWRDSRFGHVDDIFVQNISSNGNWAMPGPTVTSVADIPNDEGGSLRLTIDRSYYDDTDDVSANIVKGYNVWRKIEPTAAPPIGYSDGLGIGELQQRFHDDVVSDQGIQVDATTAAALGLPEGDWESIGYHIAMRLDSYDFLVPTRKDYVPGTPAFETYYVTAHTDDPSIYYWSAPDSGQSVDNLAPAMPAGVETTRGTGQFIISWLPNSEADMSFYSLYYGQGPDFVPTEHNRVATTTNTEIDVFPDVPIPPWHYKLAAVDRHLNESLYAIVSPETPPVPTTVAGYEAVWNDTHVKITWRLSDNPHDYDYEVTRAEANRGQFTRLNGQPTIGESAIVFQDMDTRPGTGYVYRVNVTADGVREASFEVSIETPILASGLGQNYPNPFNPSTTIPFMLNEKANVVLSVYDVNGRLIRSLIDQPMGPGVHESKWDGLDMRGAPVTTGVYFCRLQAGKQSYERKLLLLK